MKADCVESEAFYYSHPAQSYLGRSRRKPVQHFHVVVSIGAEIERLAIERQHIASRGYLVESESLIHLE